MPWSGQSFHKHNLGLSPSESSHAARIASAALKSGVPEGESIAIANKYFQRHDYGGDVSGQTDPNAGAVGLQPSNQTTNPMQAGMIQRYASMPPEKLQELAAMMGGTPQGQIVQRVLAQKRATPTNQGAPTPGTPQAPPNFNPAMTTQQPPPQAQRRGGATKRRDVGGGLSLGQADPYWARNDMREETSGSGATGYLHGTTSGRADKILTTAPAGSYILPADVVSGLGEGNSLAGAGVIQKMLATGPHGIPMPRGSARDTAPRPPPAYREQNSKGGGVAGDREQTPVALSHGEFCILPEHVRHWGGGDIKAGTKYWDEFVVRERKKLIKTLKNLPGPVKS